MASIIRADAIQNLNTSNLITQTNTTTITVGATGQTIKTPAGVTLQVDTIQNTNSTTLITQTNSTTITLGTSGQTIAVASGATLLGGGISWTSNVVTSAMTVAVNTGYFVNTSAAAITLTLPASASVGNQIVLTDFYRTWGTNALTLNTNSLNFQGGTTPNPVYNTAGQTVQIVYSGATQGWIPTSDDDVSFETPLPYNGDILLVAGGGGGSGAPYGGGAGGGGMRKFTAQSFSRGSTYTITVGDGGAGGVSAAGTQGGNSSISGTGISYTAAGGGAGGSGSGGAGGGGSGVGGSGGAGNTPSVSPSQGAGGGTCVYAAGSGGGGGGASGATGGNGAYDSPGGNGGDGTQDSITGSSLYYAGGGGGTYWKAGGNGSGGQGGGAAAQGLSGTANLGGGGAGSGSDGGPSTGGSGGKGVVILRVLTSDYSGSTTGSPTVTTDGSYTVIKYTASGSYTG